MSGKLANAIAVVVLLAGCAATPGSMAPSFSGVDTDGNAVSLAAYRDHVLILDFWAVW